MNVWLPPAIAIQLLQAPRLAPTDIAERHALNGGFGRGDEAENHEGCPDQPHCEIERGRSENDGSTAEELDDGPRLAAFGGGEAGQTRHVTRCFGNLEAIERRLLSSSPGPANARANARAVAISALSGEVERGLAKAVNLVWICAVP